MSGEASARRGLRRFACAVVTVALMTIGGAVAGALLWGGDAAARTPRAGAAVYLGHRVALSEAPWMVTLTPVDEHGRKAKTIRGHALRCSGAAIGPRRVLMAAHCIDGVDPTQLGIRVGTDDVIGNPGRVLPVARVFSPRVRAASLEHVNAIDTAVVETTKPLGVPAIALGSARPQAGEAVAAFGFGDSQRVPTEVGDLEPFLRRWDATAMSRCPLDSFLDPQEICASSPDGGGMRPGDSGGPLVVFRDGQPQLVGDTVQMASLGTQAASAFADVVALRAFVAAPPRRSIASAIVRRPRIVGDVRPGGHVTCSVGFAPKPIAIDYRWYVGGKPGDKDPVYFDRHGLRSHFLAGEDYISARRSFTLPRGAAGKRLQCTAMAFEGGLTNAGIAIVARVPRS
jgi:hypothetical protein